MRKTSLIAFLGVLVLSLISRAEETLSTTGDTTVSTSAVEDPCGREAEVAIKMEYISKGEADRFVKYQSSIRAELKRALDGDVLAVGRDLFKQASEAMSEDGFKQNMSAVFERHAQKSVAPSFVERQVTKQLSDKGLTHEKLPDGWFRKVRFNEDPSPAVGVDFCKAFDGKEGRNFTACVGAEFRWVTRTESTTITEVYTRREHGVDPTKTLYELYPETRFRDLVTLYGSHWSALVTSGDRHQEKYVAEKLSAQHCESAQFLFARMTPEEREVRRHELLPEKAKRAPASDKK